MGYSHYWSVQRSHPRYATAWPHIIDDTRRIIDRVRSTGVVIAGPDGHREPILDPAQGVAFNGDAAADLACETLHLPPPTQVPGYSWAYCKTSGHPYDLAVAAVLLRCHLLLPAVFLIDSDGGWDAEWLHGVTPVVPRLGPAIGPRLLVGALFDTVPDASPFHPTDLPGSPTAGLGFDEDGMPPAPTHRSTQPTASGHAMVDGDHTDAPYQRVAADADALHDVLGSRTGATYQLPTTGYVVLHTWQRDGEPPQDATVFIDAAGVMDDAMATAHVQAELARLRQRGPRNVTHTLRLVHRTGDGDREIFTGGPVRGGAPART